MILTVGLIVLLALPTLIWVALHRRPHRRPKPKVEVSGPKHRWWQP
jgi:hypothetical protein